MGQRRGFAGGDLTSAAAALKSGVYTPALQAVDEGAADRDSKLTDQLAIHLAGAGAGAAEAAVTTALTRAGLLRPSPEGGTLPVFDHETFIATAYAEVHNVLMRGAGHGRGIAALHEDCERAVMSAAYWEAAALYLHAGGPAHLQRYFGNKAYSAMRAAVADRSRMRPSALAPLLQKAVTREWVEIVCADPTNKDAQAAALVESAVYLSLGHR